MVTVSTADMAAARERRAARRLAFAGRQAVLSLTLNIPGPIKDSPLLRRVFLEAEQQVAALSPVMGQRFEEATGWEGVYCFDRPAAEIKEEAMLIETYHPLGRLFDLDVFDEKGGKLSRPLFRQCFLCGRQAQLCARSRAHPIETLVAKVEQIAISFFLEKDVEQLGALAEESLLYEVSVTPKPGLVDRSNNGAHQDMDLWRFLKSASALRAFFTRCAKAGTQPGSPELLFNRLRQEGRLAEQAMLEATGGVNTHKGAIFSLGLLCGAVGRQLASGAAPKDTLRVLSPFFLLPERLAEGGFGSTLYKTGRCGGIRQEAAAGFPSVEAVLPLFQKAMADGFSENDAGVLALLHLMARTEDSCLVRRSDLQTAAALRAQVRQALPLLVGPEETLAFAGKLDRQLIAQNLSPGGSADLLAVLYFKRRADAVVLDGCAGEYPSD